MRAMVQLSCSLLLVVSAAAQERPKGLLTETGDIAGAEFRIDIPENWNGGLLMYAHGYVIEYQIPNFNEPIVRVGHRFGYAVAQSKYSRQGWAAREGVLDTEALRRHFVQKYGPTFPTIIAGHSQGGAITFETIERHPEVYDGALPMCTTSEPALQFFKQRVFDMRLLFDYFFPGLPGSVVDFPEGRATFGVVTAKARELIDKNPELAQKFVRMVNLPDVQSIPGVIAFWSELLREMQVRTGGNAFDNTNTIYVGSDDDAKLNREIPRHAADPKAQEYLRQWVSVTGNISDPVISLHTFIDQLVPAESCANYERLTAVNGTDNLFVQLWVNRPGHCAFTEDEMADALSKLITWIIEGKKPAPGEITKN